jgi:hypothetical protein
MHSEVSEIVADNRDKASKDRELMNLTRINRSRKLRQTIRDYKEDIATKKKEMSAPRIIQHEPKKKHQPKNKIHVVFP